MSSFPFHDVGVFVRVVVVIVKHRDGTEPERTEEFLGVEVGLADFKEDAVATAGREFFDQFFEHLCPDLAASDVGCDREIEDVDVFLVEFVDHEPDDTVSMLGDHADTISLSKTEDEIVFVPRKPETDVFDIEHFLHVPTNHPPDMDT